MAEEIERLKVEAEKARIKLREQQSRSDGAIEQGALKKSGIPVRNAGKPPAGTGSRCCLRVWFWYLSSEEQNGYFQTC